MADKNLGFGVVGCGVIAPTHIAAIKDVAGAELVAVCDINPDKAAKIGNENGVPFYTSLEEFLAHPGLDVVNVCVPSGYHAKIGSAAAKAGKHVLVEKPIEVTTEAAMQLIEACDQAGVKLGVISQHRFAKDIIKVKEAIDAGEFGKMVLGEASIKWYRTQQYYDSGDWRGTKALDGGGALMNQGVHYIDMLQWLMGKVVSVRAVAVTLTHNIEVEDLATAILRFENGAVGTITGSTSIFPGLPEKLEIHGENVSALIAADVLQNYYDRKEMQNVGNYGAGAQGREKAGSGGAGGSANPAAIGHSLHTAQVADFTAAVKDGRDPAITGQDALRPLEIILAIYRSAAEDKEVKL